MTKFAVPNMTCGHCRAKIETAVLDADEGAMLDFDMEAREVEIDTDLDQSQIIEAIKESGYEAKPIA